MSAATATASRSPIEDLLEPAARSWWLWMLFGVLSVAAGIIALIDPGLSLLAIAILFGSYLIVSGIFELMAGVTAREADTTRRIFAVVLAILSLIAGIICLLRPGTGILALVLVLGAFLAMSGVLQLVGAVSDDMPWLSAVVGLIDLVLGIIILAVPGIGLITLALLFGISLVFRGGLSMALGWRLRKLRKPGEQDRSQRAGTTGRAWSVPPTQSNRS
jgi:uncharacterized membrane protein HdeD (DUF308 family)